MRHSLKIGTALGLSLMLPLGALGQDQATSGDGLVCIELPLHLKKGKMKKFVKNAELPICGLEDDDAVRAALTGAGLNPDEMLADLEAEAQAEAEAAAQAEAQAQAEAEAAAQAEAEAAAEAAAEAEAAAQAEAEAEAAEAEATAQAEAEAAAAAEAEALAEAKEAEKALLEQLDQEELAAREAERRAKREARQAKREARRAKRRELREAASALLLGTDPDAEVQAEAEVETEEVTEETSRSSDETFAEVQDEITSARSGGGGGDNDALKAILGAAAAAAVVGAILDNGDEVVENQGDRVIVRRDGEYVVLKDENELLRRPGSTVETQRFDDGSTRTFVTREDGTRIMTIRDPDGVVLYRTRVDPDGTETVLIDDRQPAEPVDFEELPSRAEVDVIDYSQADAAALRRAMRAEQLRLDRAYTLQQVREVKELRELMPQVDLDSITFDTGSAAIRPELARSLITLGRAMAEMIQADPDEVFLIEGHTDSVGSELLNLALSDRRAESVALALSEYFEVPPENLIVQGYGEQFLKIDIEGDIRANRRATVRRITPLLRSASLQ